MPQVRQVVSVALSTTHVSRQIFRPRFFPSTELQGLSWLLVGTLNPVKNSSTIMETGLKKALKHTHGWPSEISVNKIHLFKKIKFELTKWTWKTRKYWQNLDNF